MILSMHTLDKFDQVTKSAAFKDQSKISGIKDIYK